MPRKSKDSLRVYFRKVDLEARRQRQTAHKSQTASALPKVEERTPESLWHDCKPKGWYFLDWHRAWNFGFPSQEHVDLYNELHPPEEHLMLEEENG